MSTPPSSDRSNASQTSQNSSSDPTGGASATTDPVASKASPQDWPLEPMDAALTTIQPGGGVVMSIELIWGRARRWYLRTFRKGFVRRMESTRQGSRGPIPIDPIDPRDVKYYRNQDTHWWAESDDPFAWRDALPFVRVGLAELVLLGGGFLILAMLGGLYWWPLAVPFLVLAGLVVWFFRNPSREIPSDPGTVVSPADGKLVQIEEIEDPELGDCIQFGIFLSIFNVHANRASLPGRVLAVRYRPGKFLNALRPESAQENENLDVLMVAGEPAGEADARMLRIRQITGQFARRIVCWVRPGDVLTRGEMFGMIKLGSRTELVVPRSETLDLVAKVGDKVQAGSTVLARYRYRIGNHTSPHSESVASDTSEVEKK